MINFNGNNIISFCLNVSNVHKLPSLIFIYSIRLNNIYNNVMKRSLFNLVIFLFT